MTGDTVLKGIVHGNTIELDRPSGLPDGQAVSITVRPLQEPKRLPPGEGIRRSAGGWSDDPQGLDEYLEWNRQQRKATHREVAE